MIQLVILLLSTQLFSSFYPANYNDSKIHFNTLFDELKSKHPTAELSELPVPTQTSAKLTIDTIHIPQQGDGVKRLLILTAGIHGVEAYTGSAIQFEFLENLKKSNLTDKMGILVVHAVNPYGYHFNRRVSENNVDLNRNISATSKHFNKTLSAYENFKYFLNPQRKANSSLFSTIQLFSQSIYRLMVYGKKQLTQIVVGGQYQYNKGIYFGGHQEEPHHKILQDEFTRIGQYYQKILHIDLHTGYGERGKLHLFSNKKVEKLHGFDKLFSGFSIDTGDDKDFYETSGSFEYFTIETFKNKQAIPMTFEFGTMDSQTIMGGFFSLKNMIQENQGFQYGYADEKSKNELQNNFIEMFNPSDPKWRESVLVKARTSLNTLLERFAEL